MQAVLFSFSKRGGLLSAALGTFLTARGYKTMCCTMPKFAGVCGGLTAVSDYKSVCAEYFDKTDLMIFIGASGIAVRTIAPCVKSKVTDPAVLVIDERANFVISLLSGHIGGANELARKIAAEINAVPVVTTATDVNNLFAVDEWAARHDMIIDSMHAAKDFAAALVAGKKAGFYSDYAVKGSLPDGLQEADGGEIGMAVTADKNNKPFDTTVVLMPKLLHLGIGCRRNTPQEKIESFVLEELKKHGFDMRCVKSIASVDLKKDEQGLLGFAAKYNLPVKFYTAAGLQKAEGDFTPSSFVKSITGVDNVCERAAVLASGGSLKLKKTAHDGVTLAVAEEPLTIDFKN